MDRLPQHPTRLHSHSTPTLIHHHNETSPSDDSNRIHNPSSFFNFSSSPQSPARQPSAGPVTSIQQPHQQQPPHPRGGSEETWFEFLRDGSTRNNVAREPTIFSSIPPPFSESSSSTAPPLRPPPIYRSISGSSTGSRHNQHHQHLAGNGVARVSSGEQIEARKRRLTAPDGSGRTGYGPNAGGFAGVGSTSAAGENTNLMMPGSLPSTAALLPSGPGVMDLSGRPSRRLTPAQFQQQLHNQPQYATMSRSRSASRERNSAAADALDIGLGRRGSDIVLPPWQPDSEVTNCPVCGRQFSLFYRKHHCRKCGRVVCGNCSAHRIRIPRQFIVHPPSPIGANIVDLTGEEEDEYSRALGGGEEVRVCNPCVPDPNFSPPPQPQPPYPYSISTLPFGASVDPALIDRHRNVANPPIFQPRPGFVPHHRPSLSEASGSRPDATRYRRHDGSRHDPHSQNRDPFSDLWPPRFESVNESGGSFFVHHTPGPSYSHRHTSSTSSHRSSPAHYRPTAPFDHSNGGSSSININNPNASFPNFLLPQNRPLPPSPPRRQIPEEDECPVCGNELPPKGPNGEETEREAHVMECIETSYAPSSSFTNTPAPAEPVPTDAAAVSIATSSAVTALAGSPTGRHSAPPGVGGAAAGGSGTPQRQSSMRARRHTGNRMLVYRATEKDCVGDEGEGAQECVICFEEFEEGVEMGRLECLCKFHRACIRKWWETKGVGSCPTHQLHE